MADQTTNSIHLRWRAGIAGVFVVLVAGIIALLATPAGAQDRGPSTTPVEVQTTAPTLMVVENGSPTNFLVIGRTKVAVPVECLSDLTSRFSVEVWSFRRTLGLEISKGTWTCDAMAAVLELEMDPACLTQAITISVGECTALLRLTPTAQRPLVEGLLERCDTRFCGPGQRTTQLFNYLPEPSPYLLLLPELTSLTLYVDEIPTFVHLAAMGNVSRLVVRGDWAITPENRIALPLSVTFPPHLESLTFSNIDLSSLPPDVENLQELQSLQLYSVPLVDIDRVTQLVRLENLTVYGAKLVSLPDTLSNLTRLQHLTVQESELTSLPAAVSSLTSLKVLNLTGNALNLEMPSTFTALVALESLDLSGSCVQVSSAEVWTWLETLDGYAPGWQCAEPVLHVWRSGSSQYEWGFIELGGEYTTITNSCHSQYEAELSAQDSPVLNVRRPGARKNLTCDEAMSVLGFGPRPEGHPADCLPHLIDIAQEQCLALVTLYEALGGPDWDAKGLGQWLGLHRPCAWTGVWCSKGEVIGLHLDDTNLLGTLPEEIEVLTSLHDLDLSNNQLNGPIPSAIGDLANLRYLDLGHNQLTGPIPANIGSPRIMYELDLSHNQLSGSLPASFAEFRVYRLYLQHNQLTGDIPATAAYRSSPSGVTTRAYPSEFDFSNNLFTGLVSILPRAPSLNITGNPLNAPAPPPEDTWFGAATVDLRGTCVHDGYLVFRVGLAYYPGWDCTEDLVHHWRWMGQHYVAVGNEVTHLTTECATSVTDADHTWKVIPVVFPTEPQPQAMDCQHYVDLIAGSSLWL